MNVTIRVLTDGVVNRLMPGVFVSDASVWPPVAGVDGFGIVRDNIVNEVVETQIHRMGSAMAPQRGERVYLGG